MKILCLLKNINIKTSITNDKEIKIVLEPVDVVNELKEILELAQYKTDQLFEVEFKYKSPD